MAKGDTETAQSIPYEFLPFYRALYQGAQEAFGQVNNDVFTGQRIADFNPNLQSGVSGLQNLGNQVQGVGNPLLKLGQQTARGDFLSPDSNPFLQNTINRAIQPVQQQLLEQILPQIGGDASRQGAFGGDRHAIVEGLATQGAQDAAGDIAGNLAFANYGQERQNQLNAGQQIQQGAGLNLLAPQFFGQAGQQQFAYQQSLLDAARGQFGEAKTAPFSGVNQFANVLRGFNPGQTGTNGSEGIGAAGNIFSGLLGGGLLLADLYTGGAAGAAP